ncbi:MAG: WYL domain-containing protein [Proteobacteria bacterium]|nr:WYL domain-containing protein [Pseudomonadota bacterium]
MSYKFDSLAIILNKLDSKETVTVLSLTDELEVSGRTVHRYISTLQVAGFPIEYDKIKNSYVFTEGYTLKKPTLSLEETLAFALAKKLLINFGPGMEKSLSDIEDKLSPKKGDFKHIILSADALPVASEQYLGLIHQAITNYQRIKLVYKALYADNPTESSIDPYYLFFREGIWYLRGDYHLEKAARTFALDRIVSLTLLDEHFIPKPTSPDDELSAAFGAFIDGEPVEVVLRFDKLSKPLVLRKKWHKSQQIKELEDGGIEARFTVNGIKGIQPWIYRWIPFVEVIAPEELRDMFIKDLDEAIKRHKK